MGLNERQNFCGAISFWTLCHSHWPSTSSFAITCRPCSMLSVGLASNNDSFPFHWRQLHRSWTFAGIIRELIEKASTVHLVVGHQLLMQRLKSVLIRLFDSSDLLSGYIGASRCRTHEKQVQSSSDPVVDAISPKSWETVIAFTFYRVMITYFTLYTKLSSEGPSRPNILQAPSPWQLKIVLSKLAIIHVSFHFHPKVDDVSW